MKTRILLITATCLAACSPQTDKSTDSASASVSEVASVALSSAGPTSSAASVTELPAGFVGKWDAPPRPCRASYRGEMQLDVTPTRLSFFESGGTIKSVKINSSTDVVADVAMSGEGETWERSMHMMLTDNGKTLTIDEGKGGIRARCS